MHVQPMPPPSAAGVPLSRPCIEYGGLFRGEGGRVGVRANAGGFGVVVCYSGGDSALVVVAVVVRGVSGGVDGWVVVGSSGGWQ
jgi:hypothetical protein